MDVPRRALRVPAYRHASAASAGFWADPVERILVLHALVERLAGAAEDLAGLQSLETGLTLDDARALVAATLEIARDLLSCGARTAAGHATHGVSGHILSWGSPLTEVVTSVLPALIRGDSVIVKPSLRGPLTPVAFALQATGAGLPAGVVNIVQGTGGDIGADLIGRRELSALYVRGGERTIAQAERAHARTNVPLHVLRGGGNVLIVGPDLDLDAGTDLDACCSISADGAVAPPRRATDGEPHRARYDRGHGRPQRPRRHRPPDVLAASTDGVATWRSGLAGCPPGAGHRTAGTGTERRELDSR